jgi:hypothetical protein
MLFVMSPVSTVAGLPILVVICASAMLKSAVQFSLVDLPSGEDVDPLPVEEILAPLPHVDVAADVEENTPALSVSAVKLPDVAAIGEGAFDTVRQLPQRLQFLLLAGEVVLEEGRWHV